MNESMPTVPESFQESIDVLTPAAQSWFDVLSPYILAVGWVFAFTFLLVAVWRCMKAVMRHAPTTW